MIHLTLDLLTIRASPYLYSDIPKDCKKDFSSKSHQWKRFSLHQKTDDSVTRVKTFFFSENKTKKTASDADALLS